MKAGNFGKITKAFMDYVENKTGMKITDDLIKKWKRESVDPMSGLDIINKYITETFGSGVATLVEDTFVKGEKYALWIDLYCSPFSAAKCHGKNPDCQGFKGGDFYVPFAKKYYPPLDGLEVGADGKRIITHHLQKYGIRRCRILFAHSPLGDKVKQR